MADLGGKIREFVTGENSETRRWEDEMPEYRANWERRQGQSGARWDQEEPHYRYGWEMRNDPRYQDRPWSEVEPELRRDWTTNNRKPPWDQAVDRVRDAWETIQLREEELRARKETVQTGEVEIRKEVVTEQKTMEVPVTHEEVVIERHPVDRRPADSEIGTGPEDAVRIPVHEERVHLEKDAVVTEELTVGKRQVEETERLSSTVRREEARVETEGDVRVTGDGQDVRRPDR